MKTNIAIILLIALGSCTSVETKLISNIERECNIVFDKDKTGDGEGMYMFRADKDQSYIVATKAKGIIDKTLNVLPFKVELNKHSYNENYYDHYEWETTSTHVTMERGNSSGHYEIKIWVLNK
jgi:hypothetical protein